MRAGAVAMVFGTRPEVVKLAPLLWQLGPLAHTIQTGQHADARLAPIRTDLGLTEPDTICANTWSTGGGRISEAVVGITAVLGAVRPDVVVVQGDTDSTLAGALAAARLEIPLVHVEAGLRAFDQRLPEEHNRIAVDHLSELLCAPTETSRTNLRREGIADDRVIVTGNTVVDAAHRCLAPPEERGALRARFDVDASGYVLATFHRPENVDNHRPFLTIVDELSRLPMPVLLPLHPRTRDRATHLGVDLERGRIRVMPPLGYRDFLSLAADAALLVTDSGGVQEEASIVGRPVLVVRRSTERPEALGSASTLVAPGPALGATARAVLTRLPALHEQLAARPSPFGDGRAAARIVTAIEQLVRRR